MEVHGLAAAGPSVKKRAFDRTALGGNGQNYTTQQQQQTRDGLARKTFKEHRTIDVKLPKVQRNKLAIG